MPSKYVPGMGNPNARIIICGEAPGESEEREGIPFVGPSGNMLNEILRYAGIDRHECYITNVCKVRPPQNDIKKLNLIGYSIEDFLPQLEEEIKAIDPNIVFGLGNVPLQYLAGQTGILNYRGSILNIPKTGHKYVGSIHPAVILHSSEGGSGKYSDLFLIKQDAKRVLEQSQFREIRRPDRCITLCKNSNQLIEFIKRGKNPPNEILDSSKYINARRCVVDVETYKTYPICIGLAFNSYEAISIPMFDDTIPNTDLVYIWQIIAQLFDECNIIAQNITFDYRICGKVGLYWPHPWFDTMMGWHTLFSELRKDLGTLVSLLTEEPYYKSEGKEYNPKKDSFDKLMSYNAKDAYSTWEVYERIHEMLIMEKMEEFYFERCHPLNELYSRIENCGILIDPIKRQELKTRFGSKLRSKEDQLLECIATLLGADGLEYYKRRNKDDDLILPNSDKAVPELLYGQLKIPFRKNCGEDTLKALVNNNIKDPIKKKVVELILECRKIGKLIGTYIEFELH